MLSYYEYNARMIPVLKIKEKCNFESFTEINNKLKFFLQISCLGLKVNVGKKKFRYK